MPILDATTIATLIGSSPSDQLEALIPAAEAWVQRECNCYVEAEATEVYDGSGVASDPQDAFVAGQDDGFLSAPRPASTLLTLRRWPVREDDAHPFVMKIATDAGRSFASVTAVPRSSYYVDVGEEFPVVLYEAGFPGALRCVQIRYTAGYPEESYPAAEKALIAELVALAVNRIGSAGLSSENFAQYSYTLQNFGELEAELSALGRATLENGRARSNVWVR